MKTPQERRHHKRYQVKIPAGVYLKERPYEPIDAEILDISEGGAFVHCTAPISIGQEVLIEIRFAETKLFEGKVIDQGERHPPETIKKDLDEASNPGKSLIRWARGSAMSGFGIEFVDLKPDKRKFLAKVFVYFEQLAKAGVDFDE